MLNPKTGRHKVILSLLPSLSSPATPRTRFPPLLPMLRSPTRTAFRRPVSDPGVSNASPSKPRRLGFAGVANLFVRLRRLENRASRNKNVTVLTSGAPKTHVGIEDGAANQEKLAVEFTDHFVCSGGVNVATLLRASRAELMERVGEIGANALLDEQ